MVAEGKFAGDFAARSGETDVAVALNADQAVFLQATEGHGDGWRGDFEPIGEARGDYGFAFAFGFEDGFEVVLFGDGNH